MSHGIISKSTATRIDNIADLKAAVEFMGLEFVECEKGKGHYYTWKDDHGGKWVGDWPLPEGVSAEAMGDNADYVIRVPQALWKGQKPYELGIVRDEADGCWYPAHDFWASGNGLEEFIGKTVQQGGKVVQSHQKLMDCCKAIKLARHYRNQGKAVQLQKQQAKLVLSIQ